MGASPPNSHRNARSFRNSVNLQCSHDSVGRFEKGWALSRIPGILCVATAFMLSAQIAIAGASRDALWRVVQTCLINHTLTGAAFPCLAVNTLDGNDRGYAILRPPFSASDLILAPTRRIIGVEDPSLEALDAPNYFEDAWSARNFLDSADPRPIARDEIVLAVNSRQARTQDQLHIHIGCLTAAARRSIGGLVPALSESDWLPLGRPFHGLEFWGRLVGADNLAGLNPFRLAAEAWPKQSKDRSQLTLAVAAISLSDGRKGFILLASYDNPLGKFSAEDFLDYSRSRCRL
jgi:CDP-diacylglycerol pyrophosphatase